MIDLKRYRPSFDFASRGNVIHIVTQDRAASGCGKDPKELSIMFDVFRQYPLIEDASFCKKCREAYHRRDEGIFLPIP